MLPLVETAPAKTAGATFNYADLEVDLASDLRARAERIRRRHAETVESIIEIGRDFIAVKDRLNHGQFIDWIETEIGFSAKTVQNYMNVARLADENPKAKSISFLMPTTLYRLAAKSTPKEVIDAVIDRVESGGIVLDNAITAMLKGCNFQRRQDKKKEHKAFRRSKAYRDRLEADRSRAAEEQRQHADEVRAAAKEIVQRIGVENAEFVLASFEKHWWSDLAEAIRTEIKNGAGVADDLEIPACLRRIA